MEAVMVKSLLTPFRKFTSCVTERLQKDLLGSEGERSKLMDPNLTVLRAYQAQKERERRLREARNMEKNAARAAMRAHFRRKYQLPTNAEDWRCGGAAGGPVVTPPHLKKVVQSKNPEKESCGLLRVFHELSFRALHTPHRTHHTPHRTHHTPHRTHHTPHRTHHTPHRTHHTSHTTQNTSHTTQNTSHITHHTEHITHHTSHTTQTHHTPHAMQNTPHITRHTEHITHHAAHTMKHTPEHNHSYTQRMFR